MQTANKIVELSNYEIVELLKYMNVFCNFVLSVMICQEML